MDHNRPSFNALYRACHYTHHLSGCVDYHVNVGKDTFYRLKNNQRISMGSLLWLFLFKFKELTAHRTSEPPEIRCLIFDDTLLEKTGKYIEKMSRVFDHVTRREVMGFKLLVMGYRDGASFFPIDFSLHREAGQNKEKPYGLKKKELRKQHKNDRKKDRCAWERAKETDMSKIDCAIKMFKRAINKGLRVDYVLMDSWFTCEAFVDAVLEVKAHMVELIGMYKIAKAKFFYREKMCTNGQIRNLTGKPKRCRNLRLYYTEAEVKCHGHYIKLFFTKHSKNGKWKTILCTDTSLSFVKMA